MIKVKAHYKGSNREMLVDPAGIEVAYMLKHGGGENEVLCIETVGGKSILLLDRKLDDVLLKGWSPKTADK